MQTFKRERVNTIAPCKDELLDELSGELKEFITTHKTGYAKKYNKRVVNEANSSNTHEELNTAIIQLHQNHFKNRINKSASINSDQHLNSIVNDEENDLEANVDDNYVKSKSESCPSELTENELLTQGEKLTGDKLQNFLKEHFIDYVDKKCADLTITQLSCGN